MRSDDSVYSEWFRLAQGLRQGYVLFPQLFNVFFACIILDALERFSEDSDKLADLAHIEERPSNVDPKTALECARRAIWMILRYFQHAHFIPIVGVGK